MHPMLENDYATQWLGIRIDDYADGEATVSATLRPEMMNGHGVCHGGFIFAIADSAFAFACNPADSDGSTQTVSSGTDINFLAPSFAGDTVTAYASCRVQRGRSGIYDVHVYRHGRSGEPELIAEFRGRSRTIASRTAGDRPASNTISSGDPQ